MVAKPTATSIREIYNSPTGATSGSLFHRLNNVVDRLDKNKPTVPELVSLRRHFSTKASLSKGYIAYCEYWLVVHHLDWLLRLQANSRASLPPTLQKVCSEAGLIVPTAQQKKDSTTLIYYLPLHEAFTSKKYLTANQHRKDVFDTDVSGKFVQGIVEALSELWPEHAINLHSQTLDTKVLLRQRFLQFLHWQLLQNALTHALADPLFNSNYTRSTAETFSALEGSDFLFGSIAILQLSLLDAKTCTAEQYCSVLSETHPRLARHSVDRHALDSRRHTRTMVLTYSDTGPGIERHVRHFSPMREKLPDSLTSKYILENRISGREVLDSGNGLLDIRVLSDDARAILVIETPNSTYLHSAELGLEEVAGGAAMNRGTSVSIILES
jgi:hypothetical protein